MTETARAKQLTPDDVIEAYRKYKLEQGSGSSSVASSNWPTTLAHECRAFAFYNRTVPGNERRDFTPELKMIFSEGNDQARMVKRDLEDAGFTISDQESQMSWPKYQIYGRKDFQIWREGFREKIHVEVKSASRFTYDYINKVEDLLNDRKPWLKKWYKQVCLYMVLQGVEKYWMLLKSKEKGAIKIIEFIQNDHMLDTANEMINKAEWVNKLIQIEGAVPKAEDKISDPDYCGECEFYHACLPDLAFTGGAVILDEASIGEMQEKLDRRAYLDPFRKEYEDLDEELNEELKQIIKSMASEGQSKFVIGRWIATVREQSRAGYVVNPVTFKVVKFVKFVQP